MDRAVIALVTSRDEYSPPLRVSQTTTGNLCHLSKGYFATTFLSLSPPTPASQSGLRGPCPVCWKACDVPDRALREGLEIDRVVFDALVALRACRDFARESEKIAPFIGTASLDGTHIPGLPAVQLIQP